MPWGALLSPVADATQELLQRIHGTLPTLPAGDRRPEQVKMALAHCFLVTGERGTGKSTVLMTARDVCERHDHSALPDGDRDSSKAPPAVAKLLANRVRWLDLLDVEPLHPGANFLTLLLVQIRNAIDHGHGGGHASRRVSLLEEGGNSPRVLVDKLINDAALIWEEIHETTTRERAHRQVSAAESFARFRRDLVEALAAVGKALKEQASVEQPLVLILPIDNIDRSTEHLQSIFKLAQLVTCEHLMLVFASDRVELDTLLERSYWKELIKDVPRGGSSEQRDEVLAIARRQSASTTRKLLPPNNRVKIRPVTPHEALAFKPYPDASDLRELLAVLPAARSNPTRHPEPWEPRNLLELLLTNPEPEDHGRNRLEIPDPGHLVFTAIGEAALSLPARSLLDLWLILENERQRLAEDRSKADLHDARPRFDPARVARSILRPIVAESSLPQWAVDVLQDEVVRRTADGSTQLVLRRTGDSTRYIEVRRLDSTSMALKSALPSPESSKATKLDFLAIELHRKHDLVVRVGNGHADGSQPAPDLPPRAAAWLMLLHDLLIHDPKSCVINAPEDLFDKVGPRVTAYWHGWNEGRSFHLSLQWPSPRWGTFFDHELMNQAWTRILDELERERDTTDPVDVDAKDVRRWQRLLALEWIALVLWVGGDGDRLEPWKQRKWEWLDATDDEVERRAEEVLRIAAGRLETLQREVEWVYTPLNGQSVRHKALHDWLLFRLPRFFKTELGTGLSRADHYFPPELAKQWGAPDMAHKIENRRRQSLERELRDALRATTDPGDEALGLRIRALLPKLLDELEPQAPTESAAPRS